MLHPSIDSLLTKIDSKYRLVHVVSQRAVQIELGDETLVEKPVSSKPIGYALEEFLEDKIIIKSK